MREIVVTPNPYPLLTLNGRIVPNDKHSILRNGLGDCQRKSKIIEKAPSEWEKVARILLGTFKGKDIQLGLYCDDQSDAGTVSVHGAFQFNEQLYLLPYIESFQNPDQIDALKAHPLQLEYTSAEGDFCLLSALGIPERLAKFIIYDYKNEEWAFFENYSAGEIIDVNQDGMPELFIQASDSGKSSVYIYRFRSGKFEIADLNAILHQELGIDLTVGLFATTFEKKNNQMIIKVSTVKGQSKSAYYIFKYDWLDKR